MEKNILDLLQPIFQDILDEWPDDSQPKVLQQYIYHCTNVAGFTPLVQEYIKQHLRKCKNLHPDKAGPLQIINDNLHVRQTFSLIIFY